MKKEVLIELLNKHKTLDAVAELNGTKRQNIHYYVKKYGITCKKKKTVYFIEKTYKHTVKRIRTEKIWG